MGRGLRVGFLISFVLFSVSAAQAGPVLVVGDSHTAGRFGTELDARLRSQEGAVVTTVGSCGSATGHWYQGTATQCGYFHRDAQGKVQRATKAPTPLFTGLLKELQPSTVIIELGANHIGWGLEPTKKSVAQMAHDAAAQGRCYWVGPPLMRVQRFSVADQVARIDVIRKEAEAAGCTFIDSREIVTYPATGGDGIHFDQAPGGMQLAARWAQGVFERLSL